MTCAKCQHPVDWHGDRAIGGCDGGTTIEDIEGSGHSYRLSKRGLSQRCFCTGLQT